MLRIRVDAPRHSLGLSDGRIALFNPKLRPSQGDAERFLDPLCGQARMIVDNLYIMIRLEGLRQDGDGEFSSPEGRGVHAELPVNSDPLPCSPAHDRSPGVPRNDPHSLSRAYRG